MTRRLGYLAVIALQVTACVGDAPVDVDPNEVTSIDAKADGASVSLPNVRCPDAPTSVPRHSFRHFTSRLISALGDSNHRGIDLVAAASSTDQRLKGEIAYGIEDKALEDENVDVFACRSGAWRHVGTARTDSEGRFSLTLSDTSRLPIGIRDMYVSVQGDGTGAYFLAVVAHDDATLAVSDVDGTLTSSELAYIPVVSTDPGIQPGAPEAWKLIKQAGHIPVYVTARARTSTADTRRWLAEKGMPRGPLRLAPHLILPGAGTVDYKAGVFANLQTQLPMVLGVGNRASDVDAYTRAGLDGTQIYVKLPEYAGELKTHLQNGDAIGFNQYDNLRPF